MTTRPSANEDLNPRPLKRMRAASPISSSLSPLPSSSQQELQTKCISSSKPQAPPLLLRRIPPAALLLSLPALLVHPPLHRLHLQSISLSQHAFRRCLELPELEPREECRAWTGLAELGIMSLEASAEGLEEVEKSLTKAVSVPSSSLNTP